MKQASEWEKFPQFSAELEEDDPDVKREPKSLVVHASKAYSSFFSIVQRFLSWFKLLKFIALCLCCQMRFVTRKRATGENVVNSVEASKVEAVTNLELEKA